MDVVTTRINWLMSSTVGLMNTMSFISSLPYFLLCQSHCFTILRLKAEECECTLHTTLAMQLKKRLCYNTFLCAHNLA